MLQSVSHWGGGGGLRDGGIDLLRAEAAGAGSGAIAAAPPPLTLVALPHLRVLEEDPQQLLGAGAVVVHAAALARGPDDRAGVGEAGGVATKRAVARVSDVVLGRKGEGNTKFKLWSTVLCCGRLLLLPGF